MPRANQMLGSSSLGSARPRDRPITKPAGHSAEPSFGHPQAFDWRTDPGLAPRGVLDPGPALKRGTMTHVLAVQAPQFGDPIAVRVFMEAGDRPDHELPDLVNAPRAGPAPAGVRDRDPRARPGSRRTPTPLATRCQPSEVCWPGLEIFEVVHSESRGRRQLLGVSSEVEADDGDGTVPGPSARPSLPRGASASSPFAVVTITRSPSFKPFKLLRPRPLGFEPAALARSGRAARSVSGAMLGHEPWITVNVHGRREVGKELAAACARQAWPRGGGRPRADTREVRPSRPGGQRSGLRWHRWRPAAACTRR